MHNNTECQQHWVILTIVLGCVYHIQFGCWCLVMRNLWGLTQSCERYNTSETFSFFLNMHTYSVQCILSIVAMLLCMTSPISRCGWWRSHAVRWFWFCCVQCHINRYFYVSPFHGCKLNHLAVPTLLFMCMQHFFLTPVPNTPNYIRITWMKA